MRLHPDGSLYVGDHLSIEVIAPPSIDPDGLQVRIQIDPPGGKQLDPLDFEPFGVGARLQATWHRAWDTQDLNPGTHTLAVTIEPNGPHWTVPVHLLPAAERPAAEASAQWQTMDLACCRISYISGTSAARDMQSLTEMIEVETRRAVRELGVSFQEPISIVLMPRLLGHGGFAGDKIYISYLDRNYAGNDPARVLHHEIIHILDRQLGGDMRSPFLVEGLAVYLTGGHFKPEPLLPRAAALLDLGWYLPFETLVNDFYFSQHEVGYLEAGALVAYLVDSWGWDEFLRFYRDIEPVPGGTQTEAISSALETHFGLTLAALETRFISALQQYPLIPELHDDVRMTVQFYDAVRHYQEIFDPSAYFLFAWLPDGEGTCGRTEVADLLRRPQAEANIVLESLFYEANEMLRAGLYPETGRILDAVEAVISAHEAGETRPFSVSALAWDTLAALDAAEAAGYQVERIRLTGDRGVAWVYGSGGYLREIDVVRASDLTWQILPLAD